MGNRDRRGIKKVVEEIREEAAQQLRGFPRELRTQVTRGWGREVAKQIFGNPHRSRRRSW